MKIFLLKLLDKLTGSFAVRFLSSPRLNFTGSPRYVLFIRPGGIGDAVLLIPVLNALKSKFAHVSIDVLAEKRNSSIFSLTSSVDTVLHYHKPSHLLRSLKNPYDVVIDSEQWHRLSAVVARLTRASMSIGFATNDRKKLFTNPIPYSHEDFELNSFFNLLGPLRAEHRVEHESAFLTIPLPLSEKIKPLLLPLSGLKLVALFPGGSTKEKRWDIDKFRAIAKKMTGAGYGVVIVGGKEDIRAAHLIESDLRAVINLCAQLSLLETAAVLQEVELLISGDSGIMHIASSLEKKIVALFGPSNIKKWSPRRVHVAVITKDLDCSPCSRFGYTPHCKNDALCMKQITVDEVYQAAVGLLER